MKKSFIFLMMSLFFVIQVLGCASQTSREKVEATRSSSHAKPAADYMDGFWLDYRSPPDREAQHWEFYFKNCSLISRKPWPDRTEYECMGPH